MLLKVVAPCMILEMIARRVNFSLYWGKTKGKVADIKGWVLADLLDDAQFELLLREGKETLSQFQTPEGGVSFNSPAHIFSASKA
jgi:hypothetical protein